MLYAHAYFMISDANFVLCCVLGLVVPSCMIPSLNGQNYVFSSQKKRCHPLSKQALSNHLPNRVPVTGLDGPESQMGLAGKMLDATNRIRVAEMTWNCMKLRNRMLIALL